jgi:hypothetical protein
LFIRDTLWLVKIRRAPDARGPEEHERHWSGAVR